MIRLLIADSRLLIRTGLERLFGDFDDISITSDVFTGEEILLTIKQSSFNVILLTENIKGAPLEDLIPLLRDVGNCPILVLSRYNEIRMVKRMLKVGSSGYITEDASPDELIAAVRKVADGGKYITPELAEKIAFETSPDLALAPHELLSDRELVILRMLAKGKKVTEIAIDLEITRKTVSAHKARLMKKMHIQGDIKLMQYVLVHGLSK